METKKPRVSISSIEFSGGDCFSLEEGEKIILVGANNSGKSQSLREIIDICGGEKERPMVVVNVELTKEGTATDLKHFLDEEAEFVRGTYRFEDWNLPDNHVQFWANPFLIHGLLKGFVQKIAADDRLQVCSQQNSISPGEQMRCPHSLEQFQ